MDDSIEFYDYKLKKKIIIKDYIENDTLITHKKKFLDQNIDFNNSIFVNNFIEIKKTTPLSEISKINNLIINKNLKLNSVENKEENIEENTDKKTYKYFSLLKKYPDLMLFVYMINNNNLDDIIYFLKKYYIKNKQIYNIIKNNQTELIEMINSQPDIVIDFFKKTDNIYSYSYNLNFTSIINYFANSFSNNTIIYQLEDLFPDVPTENINELIQVFSNNVLII